MPGKLLSSDSSRLRAPQAARQADPADLSFVYMPAPWVLKTVPWVALTLALTLTHTHIR